MISKTIAISTLPARTVVRGSLETMESANLIPGGLMQFQKDMLALMDEFDADYIASIDNMTEDEREVATCEEIKAAEHHISHALISMSRLVKLALADDSRVIEHKKD